MTDPSNDAVFRDNVAHSMNGGIVLFKDDCYHEDECTLFRNIFLYKAFNYGLYTANRCEVEVDNIIIADSHAGFLAMISKPRIIDHERHIKPVKITNSMFIGQSPGYHCDRLSEPSYESVIIKSGRAGIVHCHRKLLVGGEVVCAGMYAILMPTRIGNDISPPFKKWALNKNQPGYGSKMLISCEF